MIKNTQRWDRIPEYLTEIGPEQAKAMWEVGATVYYAYYEGEYRRSPWAKIRSWPVAYSEGETLKFVVEAPDNG